MDKLHFFACMGVASWGLVIYFFICVKIQKKWLEKNMNLQWIKDHEKKTKCQITKWVADTETVIQFTKTLNNIIMGFIIFSSIHFLLDFFLNSPYDTIVFGGLILAGESIPAWTIINLINTFLDNRIKRINEVLKNKQT